jgi:hypothetical protein
MGYGAAGDPEHTVTLSDFWMYSTEVTNGQYSVCVQQGRCSSPAEDDNPGYAEFEQQNWPVVGVTYEQARDYCGFMNAELPTEAQWEKAARGTDGRPYPWGAAEPSCDLLNFGDCAGAGDVTRNSRGASPYGVLNMAGNVYEWVADWYDPLYYTTGLAGDPPGPNVGRMRVIRSSGYRSTAIQSSSHARSFASPNDHRRDLGFRCALKDVAYFAPACQLAPSFEKSDMAPVRIDCPVISIEVQVTACRYGGGAVVTFNNDHPQDPNASFGGIVGCTLIDGKPGSYPLSYECRQGSRAAMSSSCTYSGISRGSCLPRYSLDEPAGACQWDGTRASGIDCPTGEFFDPVQHCCRVSSGHMPDFAVCPVGKVFTETSPDRYSCLPTESVRHVPPQTKAISPPVCSDLCELTPEICAVRNLVFCRTTCSCLAVGRKCPDG